MHSIMNFCPLGTKVQRKPQTALPGRNRGVYLHFKVCTWCVFELRTHVNAEGNQIVGVLEVVGDGLRQVERKLDELKGGASICGGEDDPTSVVQHGDVCRQYHLGIQAVSAMMTV